MTPILFLHKLLGKDGSVRRSVVMVKQPGLFSTQSSGRRLRTFSRSRRKTSQ
jgi:hypothetical protein